MNEFKTWCLSFCVLLAVTAVMRFIIPECKMKSVSDTFLSLIVVVAMFLPFTDKEIHNFPDFNFDMDEYSESFDESSQYEAALEKYIQDTLSQHEIDIKEIEVSAGLDDDGYIVIDEINIETASFEDAETIKNIIKDECELDVEKVTVN